MKQEKLLFRLPPCGRELILFLVCWLSALPEPKRNANWILLWHVSCVRVLLELVLSLGGGGGEGHAPNKIIGWGSAPPSSAAPAMPLKDYFYH